MPDEESQCQQAETLCPLLLFLAGFFLFFGFPFVPLFSRLLPQLSARGQRSTALSQVPAGTAATGFTHRRHKLQMWPFSAGQVTNAGNTKLMIHSLCPAFSSTGSLKRRCFLSQERLQKERISRLACLIIGRSIRILQYTK